MAHKFEVGQRYLVKEKKKYMAAAREIKVLEISPSGERVKFLYPQGAEVWEVIVDYEILEKLSEQKGGVK